MMNYRVDGTMRLGEETRKFAKVIEANSEKHAREKTYALLGSQHGIRRTEIDIANVEKIEKGGAKNE